MAATLFILYLVAAILTARSEARLTILRNEGSVFNGFELEPRIYSNREYMDLASYQHPTDTEWTVQCRFALVRNRSDYYGIIAAGVLFPLYWIRRGLIHSVCEGHDRTEAQHEGDLEERARRIRDLEAELNIRNEDEFR